MAMDIFPVIFSSRLQGVGAAAAAPTLLSSLASQGLAVFPSNSAIVELSGLGQVLSAVASFDGTVASLQASPAGGGIEQNFGGDFAGAAGAAHTFVAAFNGLQSTLAGVQAASVGGATGGLLAGQLSLTLDALATSPVDNGAAPPTGLAEIGVEFLPPSLPGEGGRLSVNREALEGAFAADQQGTRSLLEQAGRSFVNAAAAVVGEGGNASGLLGNFQLFGAVEQTQSLFGIGQAGGAPLGLADLLALESVAGGSPEATATLGRQLVALSQYSLISSLLV